MKTIKLFFYSAVFALVVYAGTLLLSDVLNLYKKDELKNSPSALILLEKKAQEGNMNASFLLATAYRNGKAGKVDLKKAKYWYEISAKAGDKDAMLMLGWLYYQDSNSVAVNFKKARYWFKQAALEGVDEAVEMLELLRE